ncbi:Solute carrier organic anion transporter family member 1C1 [Myotis davidii]|uniref:Solute carrier organic anion transporter family member n=1 Tax=Myotis davidii TaxID=225400 RepID=L5LA08_MYODS|nr:Solute carrier organic anion transporter family member 1C1 [Myotis davidii]
MDTSSKENIQLFCKNSVQPVERPSFKTEYSSSEEKKPCCGELKVFLGALSFVYFAKALAEGYLKSTITQIERRFEIPSSLVGVIDGSFEIVGLNYMKECEIDASSSMWVYVFLGNLLRGIGETPIQPLGITYLDDFASEDNAAFYIGCVQTVAIIGPIFGFLLGSLCAKLYVDIGFVNLDHITITPKDPQWVGAWWLGYLVAGVISLLAAVPFWCLPKSLPRPQSKEDSSPSSEKSTFIMGDHTEYQTPHREKAKIMEMARDFLPSLKTLLGNPVYLLYLCASTVQFNSLFGMVTYKPKYIEQQYGQSSSKANFVIGLINIPAVALGIFSGGIVMKKFRIGVYGAAKIYLGASVLGYLLFLSLFALGCENSAVAGLTVSYKGNVQPELKSLAVGFHTLTIRALGGILAPIYFGALIDRSCMKWSISSSGKQGSCRIYNSSLYGKTFLGLIESLKFTTVILFIVFIYAMKKAYQGKDTKASENRRKSVNEANVEFLNNDGGAVPSA